MYCFRFYFGEPYISECISDVAAYCASLSCVSSVTSHPSSPRDPETHPDSTRIRTRSFQHCNLTWRVSCHFCHFG